MKMRNVFGDKGLCCVMALAMVGLIIFPITAVAQITTATIIGTITDPNGAPVPSASVTARNVDTSVTRTVSSGEDGGYRLEFLPVGNYVVEITASSGFKKAYRDSIVLRVNDTTRIDIVLEVGSVDEQVTVTSAPPDINTSSAELGRTVQSREIENLPLVERNVYSLLDLTPGVQSNNNGVATASATTSNLSLGFPEQRTLINGGTDGGTGSRQTSRSMSSTSTCFSSRCGALASTTECRRNWPRICDCSIPKTSRR